jgi:hypothetical protein
MRYYAERGEIRRFVIKCRVANQHSNGVAQRNGFTLEGCLREAEYLNGRFDDVNIYGRSSPIAPQQRGAGDALVAVNHLFAAQVNALPPKPSMTASSVISTRCSMITSPLIRARPWITTLSSIMIGPPRSQPAANQNVVLYDAVSFDHGVFRNL